LRLQQAGKLVSPFADRAKNGEKKGKPKKASNAMDKNLRNGVIEAPRDVLSQGASSQG
jgi:hypothetical protein